MSGANPGEYRVFRRALEGRKLFINNHFYRPFRVPFFGAGFQPFFLLLLQSWGFALGWYSIAAFVAYAYFSA